MNDITREVRSEFIADHKQLVDREKECRLLNDKREEDRFNDLWDQTYEMHYRVNTRVILACGCVAVLTDESDPWSKFIVWRFVEDCQKHDLVIGWFSTPRRYSATRKGYEPGCPMGTGVTVDEAVKDLEEQEEE